MRPRSENDFLKRLDQLFGPATHRAVSLGRGDDAAILKSGAWCVTVDALVEGVHFRRGLISAQDLGIKAFRVNASDLNAMGTRAQVGFLSLTLPDDFTNRQLAGLLSGLAGEFHAARAALAGGNLARGKELQIHLTLMGPAPEVPLRRDRAKPGDALLLIGETGLARAGYLLLEKKRREAEFSLRGFSAALKAQRSPSPPLRVGPKLAGLATRGVRLNALDLSDGPARDALRFSARGKPLGAILDATAFPQPPALIFAARTLRANPRRLAVTGGEDYALLVACAENDLNEIMRAIAPHSCTVVGWLTAKPGLVVRGLSGVAPSGFDHLSR